MFDEETVERCPSCKQVMLRPILAAEVNVPLLWVCTLCDARMSHKDLLIVQLAAVPETPKPTLREKMMAVIHRG